MYAMRHRAIHQISALICMYLKQYRSKNIEHALKYDHTISHIHIRENGNRLSLLLLRGIVEDAALADNVIIRANLEESTKASVAAMNKGNNISSHI